MLDFRVQFESKAAEEILSKIAPKEWPFLLSYAANKTATSLLAPTRDLIKRSVQNPKPFTLRVSAKLGNKSNPKAIIQWPETDALGSGPGKYLKPITFGGDRPQKRFESAISRSGLMPTGYVLVPTSVLKKDAYGNVAGGGSLYTKILSYLRANPSGTGNRSLAKSDSNDKNAKRREKKRARAIRYLVVGPNSTTNLKPGIYERQTTIGGKQNSTLSRIFSMHKSVSYSKRFPFIEYMTTTANGLLPLFLADGVRRFVLRGKK